MDSNILVSFPPSRIIDLEHEMKTLFLSLLRFRIWANVLGELSFFLRIIPKTMMLILNHQKAAERGGYGGERYEQLEFQKKVAKCYQALCDSSWKVILSFYCNNQTCMVAS
jgi:thymidylate kinase